MASASGSVRKLFHSDVATKPTRSTHTARMRARRYHHESFDGCHATGDTREFHDYVCPVCWAFKHSLSHGEIFSGAGYRPHQVTVLWSAKQIMVNLTSKTLSPRFSRGVPFDMGAASDCRALSAWARQRRVSATHCTSTRVKADAPYRHACWTHLNFRIVMLCFLKFVMIWHGANSVD